jgi:hypothetical protein
MKPKRVMQTFAVLVAAGILGGCAEQTRSRMDIDPLTDQALRKMGATIGGARSFSFHSVATMEELIDTGQMAEFSREVRFVVRRPDRLRAEGHEGDHALTLWYEGKTLTVFEKVSNTCASVQVPGRLDAMLDNVADKHGLTFPLSDLLFSDPYKVLTADAHMGRYVGLEKADGAECHHLLFTQERIDWQIWIDAGDKAVPRKFSIDYKNAPGRPQFTAVLSDWNLSAQASEDQFKPIVPKDARKAEITQLLTAGEGE